MTKNTCTYTIPMQKQDKTYDPPPVIIDLESFYDPDLVADRRWPVRCFFGGIQQGVLDEDGQCSQDEGSKKIHVDVVPHAV